jgi:SAM-dependent methyltransferase
MRLSTVTRALTSGRARLLFALRGLADKVYRVEFLAAAARAGLLEQLARGEVPVSALMRALAIPEAAEPEFRAWLCIGERVGEIRVSERGVSAVGLLARALAEPEHDDLRAMVEQFARYRHVYDGLELLRSGKRVVSSEADGALIARASLIAEPLVEEAVERFVPRSGRVRLLEVGCGVGRYMRHAASLNPDLSALGVELDANVAKLARENLVRWQLSGRAAVVCGDLRSLRFEHKFDLITLHNNIYYFPVAERVALFARVRSLLAQDGSLLITTSCHGGTVGIEVLNLYWTLSDSGGRLPTPEELSAQLVEAGFSGVKATRLMPGEAFFAFSARPAHARSSVHETQVNA